jgi:endogenous inhibitor of DNA gyrase (YacG/DUF329 family)
MQRVIEDTKRTCPSCAAEVTPVPIVYGYPTVDAFEEADAGRLHLGGCIVTDDDPEFACPACGAALPASNSGEVRPDA